MREINSATRGVPKVTLHKRVGYKTSFLLSFLSKKSRTQYFFSSTLPSSNCHPIFCPFFTSHRTGIKLLLLLLLLLLVKWQTKKLLRIFYDSILLLVAKHIGNIFKTIWLFVKFKSCYCCCCCWIGKQKSYWEYFMTQFYFYLQNT